MSDQIVLDFGEDGNGSEFTRDGWSNPEPDLRWTTGMESVLVLPRPPDAARYAMWLTVQPHIRQPMLARQLLIVAVNDVIVSVSELTRSVAVECDVPRFAFELADEPTIRLIHPHAASPRQLADIADDRLLAVAVKQMGVRWYLPIDMLSGHSELATA
jgi:hypothetical protein